MTFTRPSIFRSFITDHFQAEKISNELAEFRFDYFYNGKRLGRGGSIELFVVTYLIDEADNMFLRYCGYQGHKKEWKNQIRQQMEQLMSDIDISREIINAQLRYFEVDNDHFLETGPFENKYLEIKSKG